MKLATGRNVVLLYTNVPMHHSAAEVRDRFQRQSAIILYRYFGVLNPITTTTTVIIFYLATTTKQKPTKAKNGDQDEIQQVGELGISASPSTFFSLQSAAAQESGSDPTTLDDHDPRKWVVGGNNHNHGDHVPYHTIQTAMYLHIYGSPELYLLPLQRRGHGPFMFCSFRPKS